MKRTSRIMLASGLALCAAGGATGQILHDNGPYVTAPPGPCIPAGRNSSLLQNNAANAVAPVPFPSLGLTINGFGVQYAAGAGNTLADDFVVPAPGWHITSMKFNAYMSGNTQTATSPMLGVYVRIWDGPPSSPTSHIVFGDLATNRMTSTTFTGAYRHAQNSAATGASSCALTRPLWDTTAAVTVSLDPGTYWVEWMIDGLLAGTTGPFAPPVTILEQPGKPGANALQSGATALVSGAAPPTGVGITAQDMPFIVTGTVGAPATGACCKPDGFCEPKTAVACALLSGVYGGDNIGCGSVTCAQPGACCKPDVTCELLASFQCAAIDGAIYRGNGTSCPSVTCTDTGACCQLDGTCSLQAEASCKSTNGIFRGFGSACAAANCPTTYNYLGNPVAIPDGGVAGTGTQCGALAFASITVNDSFTIGGADASLFVTHTWQGDTKFWLQHMTTNTRVQIINQPSNGAGGYGSDNFGGGTSPGTMMRLVDSAPTLYRSPPVGNDGIANVHFQWKPENPLAAFSGENSAGEWQLQAQDCGGTDTGNIEYWVLALHKPGPAVCYANCDESTTAPVLNVADFTCFLTKYASGSLPYANCDNSTTAPVLNVADFTCFLTKYASGCP